MSYLIEKYGGKTTILGGLLLQALQLVLLGFSKRWWTMWISGIIVSLSSITYPALSAYISTYADADKQGLVQGLITGVRSLCSGIGPAMFGLLFYIFNIDMYEEIKTNPYNPNLAQNPVNPFEPSNQNTLDTRHHNHHQIPMSVLRDPTDAMTDLIARWIVAPPFLIGALLVLLASLVATFIPDTIMSYKRMAPAKSSNTSNYYRYTNISSNGNCENGIPVINDNYSLCEITQYDHD